MRLPEFKFTAYSGTSLENFKKLAFVSDGKVFYKKDKNFRLPSVYYTASEAEAIYYARVNHPPNPLIMCTGLPFYRRTPLFYKLPVFPVDFVLIPDRYLPTNEFPLFDRPGYKPDYSQYFKPADARQILGI